MRKRSHCMSAQTHLCFYYCLLHKDSEQTEKQKMDGLFSWAHGPWEVDEEIMTRWHSNHLEPCKRACHWVLWGRERYHVHTHTPTHKVKCLRSVGQTNGCWDNVMRTSGMKPTSLPIMESSYTPQEEMLHQSRQNEDLINGFTACCSSIRCN